MISDLILTIVFFVIWILILEIALSPIKHSMEKNELIEIEISLYEILDEQEKDLNTLEDYVITMQVSYLQRPYFYERKKELQNFIFYISDNINYGRVEKAKEQMLALEDRLDEYWKEILEASELEY